MKQFSPDSQAFVLPVTLEKLSLPVPRFDTVFSMGVLYHRRSPIDHLKELHQCLRPGGELVLETLYVEGQKGYSLMPEDRYARMPNVWFIPSLDTLTSWLQRCRYEDIKLVDTSVTTATVKPDPRIKATPQDYEEQALILSQISDVFDDIHDNVNRMRDAKTQVEAVNKALENIDNVEELIEKGKLVIKSIKDWESNLTQPKQY